MKQQVMTFKPLTGFKLSIRNGTLTIAGAVEAKVPLAKITMLQLVEKLAALGKVVTFNLDPDFAEAPAIRLSPIGPIDVAPNKESFITMTPAPSREIKNEEPQMFFDPTDEENQNFIVGE